MSKSFSAKIPALRPVVLLSVLVLTTSLAASLWLYRAGVSSWRAKAFTAAYPDAHSLPAGASASVYELLPGVEDWALKLLVTSTAGATAAVLVVVFGVVRSRFRVMRCLADSEEQQEADAREVAEVRSELNRRKIECVETAEKLEQVSAEIEKRITERTADLAQTCAKLQGELNARKQAEKSLAQQAQELGRSKGVLELHVQARTQELQILQHRYEHILNSAGEGIYGLDLQGLTTFVNPAAARLTGWSVEELVGKPEQEVFFRENNGSNEGPNGAEANPASAAKRNGEHLGEEVFLRKDGSSFQVEYVRTPILEKDKLVGTVVIFKDITERKRTEETLARKAAELARSNAELEQFAYVASHDLQEPLRKIQAFGDRLKSKCDAVELKEGREYLERMQSAAARMQRLINDLLTFSRVISTTQPFVAVDLGAVIKEVLSDLEVRIEQTKARVEVGPLPTLEADAMQMRQLLQNLIGNALKFQPPDAQPVVKVQAQILKRPFAGGAGEGPDDEVCELTVEDNGIGFDDKYADRIFAVFQRLHGRTEYEGTGVGLAVCRRITDRHGGTIAAKGKPGEGATFTVTLPVRHPKPKQEKAP